MSSIILETATVRVAALDETVRLLTVLATCFGSFGACASARLVPRRHDRIPEDGLWDIDLICAEGALSDETPPVWRDVAFTGEADWCQGVRLHGPGRVLEHRLNPFAGGAGPRTSSAPAQLEAVTTA
ncbi:MAG: hypothetical protein ACKOD3_09065 [Phenylobacterium sp.]